MELGIALRRPDELVASNKTGDLLYPDLVRSHQTLINRNIDSNSAASVNIDIFHVLERVCYLSANAMVSTYPEITRAERYIMDNGRFHGK